MFEIRNNRTKYGSDFETEQILQQNGFEKRRNPNVQISDTVCIIKKPDSWVWGGEHVRTLFKKGLSM